MADNQAANIGANFSNYQGNPGLGGYGLGYGRIDTRGIEDLARYTMLYNREEALRLQKEQEKQAKEIIDLTGVDLSTTIPKDAKILQDKYDQVIDYVRKNPDALNYAKDKNKWIEYNKMKADLLNDINFAGIRSVANVKRKQAIADETNEEIKKILEQDLATNIDQTDIRTPLNFDQKYDLTIPQIGENKGIKTDYTKAGSNQIFQRGYNMFDVKGADRRGAAYGAGIDVLDPNTATGARRILRLKENPWQQMSLRLNQAIAGAKDPQSGVVDVSKLQGIPGYESIQAFNDYALQMRNAIANGEFTDKLGNKITFHNIPVSPDDYKEINVNDGISAAELYKAAEFSKWGGDTYDTKVIQTDDALQQGNLAARWAEIGIQKDRLNQSKYEDLVSATAVIREAADVLKGGTPRLIKNPDGTTHEVSIISDPNLLREFGTIDKDGNVTNVPNNVYYDKAANKLQLVYYRTKPGERKVVKNDDGTETVTTLEPSEFITNKKGDREVDRTVDMSATQWLGQIAKRKNPNKEIGGVNALIETFFNSKGVGRNLSNLGLIYGQNVEGVTGRSSSESSSSSTPTGKTVALSTIKSLVGKRGYEGYTEQELIDYYKSQGYEIK